MDETERIKTTGAGMDQRIYRPNAKRRKRLIQAFIAVAAIIAATAVWAFIPPANSLVVEEDKLTYAEIERAPFRDFIPLRTRVAPLETVFIASVAGGQVEELIAEDGSLVAKGNPIVRLVNPQLELDVASRSAAIAGNLGSVSDQRLAIERSRTSTDDALATAKNALLQARAEHQAQKTLFEKGIVNAAWMAPFEAELAFRQERLSALENARQRERVMLSNQMQRIGRSEQQLVQSLSMVRGNLDALTVRAPASGRLTALSLQPGQSVAPGDPIAQIDSENAWKLIAAVDQFYLDRVELGQRARAQIAGKATMLKVVRIIPQVTDGQFQVELGFSEALPPSLRRGQTIDVRLILGADQPAIVAPAGGWLDAGGGTVFVLEDQRAQRRAITTGRRNPDQVEVLSGLKPGDRIITSTIDSFAEYDTLIIR